MHRTFLSYLVPALIGAVFASGTFTPPDAQRIEPLRLNPDEETTARLSQRNFDEWSFTDCQWDVEVRLTNNTVSDCNEGDGQRQIAVDLCGRVHVVWVSERSPGAYSPQIYYCRYYPSTGWTLDTCLSGDIANIGYSYNPAICVDSMGDVHIVWCVEQCISPEGYFIAYKSCTPTSAGNGGWTPTTRITEDTLLWYKALPDINASPDGRLHLVYCYSYITPPPVPVAVSAIAYKEKIDTDWQPRITITSEARPFELTSPRVAADRFNNIHLVWAKQKKEPPYYSAIGYQGRFGGIWDTLRENIAGDITSNHSQPSIAVNPLTNRLHIVWSAGAPYSRIVHKERLGTYASDTFQLIGDTVSSSGISYSQTAPCIAFSSDGIAHTVWKGFSPTTSSYQQIYYNIRFREGHWGTPTQLTCIDGSNRGTPCINTGGTSANPNDVHIIWCDERDGNPEIYYKHYGPIDVGVIAIIAPRDRIRTGEPVIPQARVKNFASGTRTFLVRFTIGTIYYNTKLVANLAPNSAATVFFEPWTPITPGEFSTQCVTLLLNDETPGNDTMRGTVEVYVPEQPGWTEKAPLLGPAKNGAFLVFNPDNGLLYAARGDHASDFYSYDPNTNTWTPLNFWPTGGDGKQPYTGGNGCYGAGYIWAIKGNNTREFWRYSIETGNWEQLGDVPTGASGKPVKGGSDLIYVDNYVYLLKGYRQEFFRYNTTSNCWESLPYAPAGERAKWDKGSWLVYDGVDKIYAHKAKYSEMWIFNLTTQEWEPNPVPGIPLPSTKTGKNKKSKDGSDAVFYNGFIYALKGGNTCEWWCCDVASGTYTWVELEPIPEVGMSGKKRRVKDGGSLASTNDGLFYALKGGKSREFWRYRELGAFAPHPDKNGIMAAPSVNSSFSFRIAPNPATKGYTVLSYNLPAKMPVQITLFDITGRTVYRSTFVLSGQGTKTLALRHLARGVYLMKLKSSELFVEEKLLVP
ncbi:MAG: T9SS type A sorting domain-containing protein [candidate division WOR-3 bacterium]|jgi:hypothetical protein|nr:T9SS type A sorting domain-containing protein [candidate division WOR-3 bacterium]MDH7519339.1 T9SS type A sorting domain-containing protein [bacterium]